LLSPVLGHLSDRVGRILPLLYGLGASAVALLLLPLPGNRFVLSAAVVLAGVSFGSFWSPGMSLLSDAAESRGLDHGYAMALVNIAWAPGQAGGAWISGRVASATADAVPYVTLSGLCALTLAALWRSRSSS
jgi:predicted MFS family arabinose efflux permease